MTHRLGSHILSAKLVGFAPSGFTNCATCGRKLPCRSAKLGEFAFISTRNWRRRLERRALVQAILATSCREGVDVELSKSKIGVGAESARVICYVVGNAAAMYTPDHYSGFVVKIKENFGPGVPYERGTKYVRKTTVTRTRLQHHATICQELFFDRRKQSQETLFFSIAPASSCSNALSTKVLQSHCQLAQGGLQQVNVPE